MAQNILKENNKLLFILLWIALWLSIGTFPTLKSSLFEKFEIREIIFQIRLYFPIIIIGIIFLFKFLKIIKINIADQKSVLLFYLIFALQFVGLILNNDRSFDFSNIYLAFYSILSIFVISNLNIKSLEKIQIINLFFIVLAFTVFIIPVYKTFIDLENNNLFMYYNEYWNDNTLGTPNARVTGIARYCLLILIFFYSFFITQKKNIFLNILILALSTFFILNVWMLQSRLIIGSLFLIFCSGLLIKNKKYGNFSIISIFLLLCFIVYFTFHKIQIIKQNFIIQENVISSLNGKDNIKNYKEQLYDAIKEKEEILKNEKNPRILEIKNSSGRRQIWERLINNYDHSKIFGYGPQADRFLLKNLIDTRNLDNNASNGILYSFASGGYIAVLLYFLVIIMSIKIMFKLYLKNLFRDYQPKFLEVASFLTINFMLIRQLFENSFAVFGVDLLIFLSCFFYLSKRLEK